jgi:hypothetical protein
MFTLGLNNEVSSSKMNTFFKGLHRLEPYFKGLEMKIFIL